MGKGRQLAGMMLENFLHGRRKHVWISVGNDLAFDARRDLDDLGCGGEDSSSSSNNDEDQDDDDDSADDQGGGEDPSSEAERDLGGGRWTSSRARTQGGRAGRLRGAVATRRQQASVIKGDDEGEEIIESHEGRKRKRDHKERASTSKGASAGGRRGAMLGGGGVFIDSFQQNKHAYGTIRDGDGVMFLTYSSLVAANRDGKSRLKQARLSERRGTSKATSYDCSKNMPLLPPSYTIRQYSRIRPFSILFAISKPRQFKVVLESRNRFVLY